MKQINMKQTCTISEHIPTDNGTKCRCGYFRKAKLNLDDVLEAQKELHYNVETMQLKHGFIKNRTPLLKH